jgi:hypothetical protein
LAVLRVATRRSVLHFYFWQLSRPEDFEINLYRLTRLFRVTYVA